jgi:hypothetical protein
MYPDYDAAVTSSSESSEGSSLEMRVELQEGPLRAEVTDDRVSLDIETPTVTVSSQGKNTFGVAYDPASEKSFVTAYQYPVQVQPTNSNQETFTLEPASRLR